MGLGKAILAGLKKPKKPKYKSKYERLSEELEQVYKKIENLDKNDPEYYTKAGILQAEVHELALQKQKWSPESKARRKEHKEKMAQHKKEWLEKGWGWKGVSKDPSKDKRRKNPLKIDN